MGISKSRMRDYYDLYNRVGYRTLDDVYGRYSGAKRNAWESIRERVASTPNSRYLTVLTASTSSFTTGYMYTDEQGQKHFVVDTPSYTTDVLVSDL